MFYPHHSHHPLLPYSFTPGRKSTFSRSPPHHFSSSTARLPSQLTHWTGLSHTCTVVRECCKGDNASQWRNPKFDPPPPRSRWGDYVVDPYTCAKVPHDSPRGFVSGHAWLCAPKVFTRLVFFTFFRFFGSQPRPLDRFWRKICQNMRFRTRMCLFGVAVIKSNI